MAMSSARLRIDLISLFPNLLEGFLQESLIRRALEIGLLDIRRWNLRDWSVGKHRPVDDRPYGGGPGMVLMAPPIVEAVEAIRQTAPEHRGRLLAFTPQGRRLDQAWVRELANEPRLILIAGRYEGFDERVFEILRPESVSIGDYVLSGGEVPAMVLIEAVSRFVPGVLGDLASARDDSFAEDGVIEYPHYTRPRQYRGHSVPDVLLNGDHPAIARWREDQSRRRTVLHRESSDPRRDES